MTVTIGWSGCDYIVQLSQVEPTVDHAVQAARETYRLSIPMYYRVSIGTTNATPSTKIKDGVILVVSKKPIHRN